MLHLEIDCEIGEYNLQLNTNKTATVKYPTEKISSRERVRFASSHRRSQL